MYIEQISWDLKGVCGLPPRNDTPVDRFRAAVGIVHQALLVPSDPEVAHGVRAYMEELLGDERLKKAQGIESRTELTILKDANSSIYTYKMPGGEFSLRYVPFGVDLGATYSLTFEPGMANYRCDSALVSNLVAVLGTPIIAMFREETGEALESLLKRTV